MALNIGKLFGRSREQMLNNKNPELDRVVSEGQGYGIAAENGEADTGQVWQQDPATALQAESGGLDVADEAPPTFELTPAGSHAQALDATGGTAQATSLAGDRFVAAREASTGTASGVHDIHMNQGNSQSIQQSMQNENRQFREGARTQPPDAQEPDGVMQHNQTDLEFARAPRPGDTANNEYGDSGPMEIKLEDVANDSGIIAKWEGPDFDASKNEVSIESLEVAHEGILAGNGNHNQPGVVEDLNVKYTLLDGEDTEASGVTEDASDPVLNIKSDSEVTDYAEGGTSLDDFNPKEAGTGDGFVYDWIKSSALPEVDDQVLVEFQAREPGRIEFPNLARAATSDTMPMEEVHFVRGTGQPAQLDDDGPSNLLGDFDGDGRVDTTDAMSLNFEEIKFAAIHDGVSDDGESDVFATDFDGIEIPD